MSDTNTDEIDEDDEGQERGERAKERTVRWGCDGHLRRRVGRVQGHPEPGENEQMSNVKIKLLPLPDAPIPTLVSRIALEESYLLAVASLSALAVDAIHKVWFALSRADGEGIGRGIEYTVDQRVAGGERYNYWASVTELLHTLHSGASAINAAYELRGLDDIYLSLACEIRFGAGGAPGNPCAAVWRLEQFLLALERWARGNAIDARAAAQAPTAPGHCPSCGLAYEQGFPPHQGPCHHCQDIARLREGGAA
jgi:hypothetical protein